MIELYAAATPNGRRAAIGLEEAGLPYRLHRLELSAGQHRTPEFLRLNPNGKIPVLSEPDEALVLAESGAILIYLAERSGMLLPPAGPRRFATLQWLFFQVGSVGPMSGQYNHFRRRTPRDIYAFERYQSEVLRILGVMETALKDREFLAGEFSVADIALVPWLRALQRWEMSFSTFPGLVAWYQRVLHRPAVQRGFKVLEVE
ncbi:MAG: glutathione S-transferase family protein [Rhodobacteraceae bacterium]|nr:glutathione S-transferase family protein [Paracoccaceae bacterium]